MTQNPQNGQNMQLDRSEMFAVGAAAGAVIAAAISEYLERRKPQTPLEKAQARGAEVLGTISNAVTATSKRTKKRAGTASNYVEDLFGTNQRRWYQTKKTGHKKGSWMGKEGVDLKDAAVAALGLSAMAGVTDKVRDYATAATERVVGDPYAVSGSVKETLKERADMLRKATGNAKIGDRAREWSDSTSETLRYAAATAGDSLADYTTAARETIKDAHLGDRARELGSSISEYADTTRKSLRNAQLGEKTKDYTTLAGAALAAYSADAARTTRKAATTTATKVSENASHFAEVTSEQASDLRKGVRKGVKRCKRRARWGLRAFIIGLVIGVLTAPQSGQRTRDALTQFVENILDVFMAEDQPNRQTSF